ncbi:MAG: carboxymuconolactone decarboxylase family protein [Euryarchaeota archaeon]|nr:carboxymuconolactone decarboxylase family protein [Euryarchaeota archaeon]MDE2046663.1 carboxymuconolactone decarboxylase family protein [Thermoplasmata archaeon]
MAEVRAAERSSQSARVPSKASTGTRGEALAGGQPGSARAEGSSGLGRIDYGLHAQGASDAQIALQRYVDGCDLDRGLLELVRIRASQLNGCAYCLSLHIPEALEAGESETRIHLLTAWAESGLFSPREQAALAWTEAVTRLDAGHVPEEIYDCARQYFSEKELVDLTWAIVAINGWNRLSVSFRRPPRTNAPRE